MKKAFQHPGGASGRYTKVGADVFRSATKIDK